MQLVPVVEHGLKLKVACSDGFGYVDDLGMESQERGELCHKLLCRIFKKEKDLIMLITEHFGVELCPKSEDDVIFNELFHPVFRSVWRQINLFCNFNHGKPCIV